MGSAAQQFHLALYARSRRDRGDEGDGESNSAADEHTGGAGLESEAAEARAARRDVGVAGAVRRSPCPGLRSRGRSRVDSLAPSGTPRGRNHYCHCWQRKALRAGTSLGVSSQGHRLRRRAVPPPSSAHGLGSHHVSPALEASKTRKISPFFFEERLYLCDISPGAGFGPVLSQELGTRLSEPGLGRAASPLGTSSTCVRGPSGVACAGGRGCGARSQASLTPSVLVCKRLTLTTQSDASLSS